MARESNDRLNDAGDELPPVSEPTPAPEPSPFKPVRFADRINPRFGYMELRERSVAGALSWPGFMEAAPDAEDLETQARRNLEAVGSILRRMERDQHEIDGLRTETRRILAGLAA
jgi:hypothetical protein